jgi:hypothetical protein
MVNSIRIHFHKVSSLYLLNFHIYILTVQIVLSYRITFFVYVNFFWEFIEV